jgi:SAM-dependent methyltransferase
MSNQSNQTTQPSPMLFFQTARAYQLSAALQGAIDLDLFTAIGEGKATTPEIAARCAASERGVRILCDNLTVIGFLTKEGTRYRLTPDSATFLDMRSPTYIGRATEFLLSPMLTSAFQDVAAAVRKGGTVLPDAGGVAPENPVWVTFAKSMGPLAALPARLIADLVTVDAGRKVKILDLGAGHGLFGITLAHRYPNAEVVAQDWANVLEVARENARKADLGDRFRTLPGNTFEVEFGSGYDIVLIPNLLHQFDIPSCETLLRKVHAALAPGGRAVTLEMIPNEDRVSPPAEAAFGLTMLTVTPGGDIYTFSELEGMFRAAGFQRNELHPLPTVPQQAVISYR